MSSIWVRGRSALFAGAAVSALIQAPAGAQTAAGAPPADTDTVVVTGFRASQRAAIRAKETADVILDAVSQDDIGRLPDLNIVEASRRIVGLSTVGGLDPTKNRDIYQRATIRGLDPKYNLITLDGAPLASSEWTVRGARLEQFPASLVARIEAIKSVTAEYDPHALGGQLNLVTKSAFEVPSDRFLALNAYVGQNSSSGDFIASAKPSVRADSTGALTFGDHRQFGLVLSAEYQRLYSSAITELPGDTAGAGWSYYTAAGTATPFKSLSASGFMAPVRIQDFAFDNDRQRASVNAKFEYRPNDRLRSSLFAGYYYDKDTELRSEILTSPKGAVLNQTATSGSFATGDYQQGIVQQPQTRKTAFFNAKASYAFDDRLRLDAAASASRAIYDEERVFQKWAASVTPGKTSTNAIAGYGFTYTIQDGFPRAVHNTPAQALNLDSYQVDYIRDVFRKSQSDLSYGTLALNYNNRDQDRGLGGRLGVAYTRNQVNYDVVYSELTPKTAAAQAQIGGLTGLLMGPRTPARVSEAPYLTLDPNKVLALVAANPSLFVATDQTANNYADDFLDVEKTTAGFAQLSYRTDAFYAEVGLRQDSTHLGVRTNQASVVAGTNAYTPLFRTSDYDFLLPSAVATYRLTPRMRITAAATQTIGRPDYSQYAARNSFSVGTTGALSVNIGNPNLKPLKSTNYDLSYEWYLPDSGLLAVAGFYKDIKDIIFTSSAVGPTTVYQGVTYTTVSLNEPLNGSAGKVKGLEFSYVRTRFGFLPPWLSGLGLNANLTLLEGSFGIPMSAASQAAGGAAQRKSSGLILQPDYIANATLFYLKGPWEGRLSYNRIGKALQSVDSDTPDRDLYQEARDQLDVQLRYVVRRGLEVVVQGQNLGRSPFVVRQGPGLAYINNYFPVGSTVWLGLSWKP